MAAGASAWQAVACQRAPLAWASTPTQLRAFTVTPADAEPSLLLGLSTPVRPAGAAPAGLGGAARRAVPCGRRRVRAVVSGKRGRALAAGEPRWRADWTRPS